MVAGVRVGPALAFCVALAGCTGAVLDLNASPATIPAETHEAHAYANVNTTEVPLSFPIGVPGLSRAVTATTWASVYATSPGGDELATIVVYSSPNPVVAGTSVNPLVQLSDRELVGFLLERLAGLQSAGGLEGVGELHERGSTTLTMLGTPTQLVSYVGEGELDGRPVRVSLHVAVVDHEGDVVVALGLHEEIIHAKPDQLPLIRSVQHGGGEP